MKIRNRILPAALVALTGAAAASCSDSESYSDLLNDENRACNWYLAGQTVENEIPADSVFKTGKDAPYYKMDEEGYLYMQVVNPGSRTSCPEKGEQVYFLFNRKNILTMYENKTYDVPGTGNSNSLGGSATSTSIIYGNTFLPSTTQYGTGIQVPLDYLGYDCEVNLVLKAYQGFLSDQTSCTPYLMNVRYFKAEF